MNFTLMPSLKRVVLIKIAIVLWNRSDIKNFFAKYSYFLSCPSMEIPREWPEEEDNVIEQVSKLPLPESLKKEVLIFVRPIGLEIFYWMKYHDDYLDRYPLIKLYWTQHGKVERKKTAEVLIKDERNGIISRYRLACMYCLEDKIKELWNSVPQRMKEDICNEGYPSFSQVLIMFWTYNMEGEVAKLNDNYFIKRRIARRVISPYQVAFESAAHENKAATEFFLQKLTRRQLDESLVKCVESLLLKSISADTDRPEVNYADILCYLFSQMHEEQQVEMLERYSGEVLTFLLYWPWQSLFMENANRVWDSLSTKDYIFLLRTIVYKIKQGFTDYNYHELFGEFWQQNQSANKKYIIGACPTGWCLISDLFEIEDKEKVRLVLKDTIFTKEEIIFCREAKNICDDLIYNNKLDLVKFFVQECISSEDSVIKFKNQFKYHVINRHLGNRLDVEKDKFMKFFQFLDDLAYTDDKKRVLGEGNSNPAGRLK